MIRREFLTTGACILFFLASGCEPWGKPTSSGNETSSRDITDFKTLYTLNCSGCHGMNGMNGPGRPLNNTLYLALIPKETLRQVLTYGRPGTSMPPWAISQGGPLTDKQIDALVNGMEQYWAKPFDTAGAKMPAYNGDGQTGDTTRGNTLFMANCFACHAQGGLVGPVTDPSYLQLVSNQMLRTSIIVGREDFGMPDYRLLNGGKALTDQDVSDLVAYLVSMRPAAPAVNAHTNENGSRPNGESSSAGNKGSGNGPGSPQNNEQQGNKYRGSSQQGVGGK